VQRLRRALVPVFLFASILLVSARSTLATVLHVPGDYATIQAAIDAAVPGDIVEVACGIYAVPEIIMKSGITLRSETGEPDCVVVEPIPGPDPRKLLMCVADSTSEIRGITFRDGYDSNYTPIYIEGSPRVTKCSFLSNRGRVVGAQLDVYSPKAFDCLIFGAAILFFNSESVVTECHFSSNYSAHGAVAVCGGPTFVSCQFVDNWADSDGGAVTGEGGAFISCTFRNNQGYFGGGAFSGRNSTFDDCVFEGNSAGIAGGAASVNSCTFTECQFNNNTVGVLGYAIDVGGGAIDATGVVIVTNSTMSNNYADIPGSESPANAAYVAHGSAIRAGFSARVSIERSIISANTGSEAFYCKSGGAINVTCSDIFGNPLGDWTGCIADQLGANGNISIDPMFCDAPNGDFHLSSLSPCLYADCGVMGAFGQGCFDAKPALYRVHDVPNDQGRQVRLAWQRSLHDSPSANPYVVGYGIYRKSDQSTVAGVSLSHAPRGEGVAILGWDYLGTVPSRGDSVYETVVPTLCDSTITNGQCLSTFFISAMTSNPFVYYDSPPHSGYSKDNLAPPTPTGFAVAYNTGEGNRLTWNAVAADDWAGFNVYRADNLVATTTQTWWTDPDYDGWNVHYEVTSFDVAGNESAPAVPGTTTATPLAKPDRLELLPNVPNPFNPTTRISFATPTDGPVRLAIYDARGSLVRVLVDKSVPAGHYGAVWDGRDAKGSPVSSGVYLCRLEHRSESRTRKIVLIK
jgi:FlgD Ig-like domain